jgi:hypothetical protein
VRLDAPGAITREVAAIPPQEGSTLALQAVTRTVALRAAS